MSGATPDPDRSQLPQQLGLGTKNLLEKNVTACALQQTFFLFSVFSHPANPQYNSSTGLHKSAGYVSATVPGTKTKHMGAQSRNRNLV
jgi:hypothetical protein